MNYGQFKKNLNKRFWHACPIGMHIPLSGKLYWLITMFRVDILQMHSISFDLIGHLTVHIGILNRFPQSLATKQKSTKRKTVSVYRIGWIIYSFLTSKMKISFYREWHHGYSRKRHVKRIKEETTLITVLSVSLSHSLCMAKNQT